MSIVHNGQDLAARPGDMFLIRYGAEIAYKTQTKATFAWILYPAQWRNLRWPE
jgi:ethanolamine utilization protein EutQ (cupin superfamily)